MKNPSTSSQFTVRVALFAIVFAALQFTASAGQIALDYQPSGGLDQVKTALQEVGEMLERQHKVKSEWGASAIVVTREGINGQIQYSASNVSVRLTLTGKLHHATGLVRGKLNRELSRRLLAR